MTFPKISQGPQKSMMTAPSEIRKATGMSPSREAWSGLGFPEDFSSPPERVPLAQIRAALAEGRKWGRSHKAKAADFLSNSLSS